MSQSGLRQNLPSAMCHYPMAASNTTYPEDINYSWSHWSTSTLLDRVVKFHSLITFNIFNIIILVNNWYNNSKVLPIGMESFCKGGGRSKLGKMISWNPTLICFRSKSVTQACFVAIQCDQMPRLFLQFLALYNNEFLPNSIKSCQSRFTFLPNIKWTFKKLPKTYKILPKWQNFAKCGHTVAFKKGT